MFFINKKNSSYFCFSLLMALLSMTTYTAKAQDLTVFASAGEMFNSHNNKKDFGKDHRRFRNGDLSFTENGDIIGKYHSVATVLSVNKKTHKELRGFLVSIALPEGTFWGESTVLMDHKSLATAGHKRTGVILGGTKAYEGVSGSFEKEMLPDGKHYKTIYHLIPAKP